MTQRIQIFLNFVGEVMAEPGANLTAAILLLAAVTAFLLIIVVTVVFYLLPPSTAADGTTERKRVAQKPKRAPKTPRNADSGTAGRRGAVSGLTIAGMVVAALVVGYGTSSVDTYCSMCHQEIAESWGAVESVVESGTPVAGSAANTPPHSGVRCVACHEEAQLAGAGANVLTRSRHLVAWVSGAEPQALPINPGRCLACHADELEETIETAESRVRVSHAEPLDAGMTCDACHVGLGHRADSRPSPGMSTCLRCHDGTQVSSTCETCHLEDIAFVGRDRLVFSPVSLPPVVDCGGCHEQDTCDTCHGLRMPHSETFLSGEHARDAGFEKKILCWNCHVQEDCGKCHQTKPMERGYWGHFDGTFWKQEHGRAGFSGNAGCGCHGRSPYARAGNYCLACH